MIEETCVHGRGPRCWRCLIWRLRNEPWLSRRRVPLIPQPEYDPDPLVSDAISWALHGEAFIEKGTGRRFIRRPTRH